MLFSTESYVMCKLAFPHINYCGLSCVFPLKDKKYETLIYDKQ